MFEVAAGTHALTTLAAFKGGANGAFPGAGLIADGSGNLYGTTENGGDPTQNGGVGVGTVFKVANDANHTLSTLATFNGVNGAFPAARLIADSSGNLYGTTVYGGANWGTLNDDGTVFKVAADTHEISTLVSFDGANGRYPSGGLIADDSGNLFGTTSHGGPNRDAGTVFKVAAGTHGISTLAKFNYDNGDSPNAGLLADGSGNLYGTTYFQVFEVAADSLTLSTLATFNFNGDHGGGSQAGLIADSSGNMYSATRYGGANDSGVVFEVAAGTHTLTTLFAFNGTNGAGPGDLIADCSGNLYGTTWLGGANGKGTVFELSPPPLSGDFNRDGHVNASDIQGMVAALADLNGYETAESLTDSQLLSIGDVNRDGVVTNADLQALLNLLKSGGSSLATVAEPASLALASLGVSVAALAFFRRGGHRSIFKRRTHSL